MKVLAIDPGGTTGWAQFISGELVTAGTVDAGSCVPGVYTSDAAIVEVPDRVEPGIPLRDVITCALRAGGYLALCGQECTRVVTVPPVRWKGTLSKATTEARVRKVLTPAEIVVLPNVAKSVAHNMFDAIGIGLWALGRFGRGGGIFR